MEENKSEVQLLNDNSEEIAGHNNQQNYNNRQLSAQQKFDNQWSVNPKNYNQDWQLYNDNKNNNNNIVNPQYTKVERLLLLFALLLGFLFDRVTYAAAHSIMTVNVALSIFWLGYIFTIYIIYWKKFRENNVLWYVGICCSLMSIWSFVFAFDFDTDNADYALLTMFILPATLMAHAVYATGRYTLMQIPSLFSEYIVGWLIKPFSAIGHFFGALGSLSNRKKREKVVGKIFIGLLISVPIISFVVIPLLMSSDGVFQYFIENINVDIFDFICHIFVIVVVMLAFYSFIWNIGDGKAIPLRNSEKSTFDPIIGFTVLTVVEAIYLLFCFVQFTYLFAGAGLPDHLSYADYAHRGFGEMCAIVVINLAGYCLFWEHSDSKIKKPFLLVLAAETLVIVISGMKRITLYIDAYDLTWMRLLSLWFVIYLAFAVIVFVVKMFKPAMPALATCLFVLLAWWLVLGYANPANIIENFNDNHTSIHENMKEEKSSENSSYKSKNNQYSENSNFKFFSF